MIRSARPAPVRARPRRASLPAAILGAPSILLVATLAGCVAPPPPPSATTPSDTIAFRVARDPVAARRAWDEGRRAARLGRGEEAESWYGRAVALDPDEPTYLFAWADALVSLGRPAEAVPPMRHAIEVQEAAPEPNHRLLVVDYDRLIRLLDRLGRVDEASRARVAQDQHRRLRDADLP